MRKARELYTLLLIVVLVALVSAPIIGCSKQTTVTSTATTTQTSVQTTTATTTSVKTTTATVVKPPVVNIVFSNDITGPYGAGNKPYVAGCQDAQTWLNTEMGGIDGVPVNIIFKDTGGKLDQAISNYNQAREMQPKPLFAVVLLSADAAALRDRLTEDKIIGWTSGAAEAVYPAGYMFGQLPSYADSVGAFIDLIKLKWTKTTVPKLAFLTYDNTYGRACVTDEVLAYAKQKGVDVVATEFFAAADVSVTTQMTKIKNAGADYIYTNTAGSGNVLIMKTKKDLNYNVTVCGPCAMDHPLLQNNPGLYEGSYVVYPYKPTVDQADDPAMAKILQIFNTNKRDPVNDLGVGYTQPFVFLALFKQVTEQAVAKVGWQKLTGADVKAQLESISGFKAFNSVFTYIPGKRNPTQAVICQVQNNKLIPATDWVPVPDLRPAQFK